jgi:hypothetical protein
MMAHNTQNHWFSGLCPSSGIPNTTKKKFSETETVQSPEISKSALGLVPVSQVTRLYGHCFRERPEVPLYLPSTVHLIP